LLTGLPVLQTHRPGLACSRDYWSCGPQPLTELPVLQTHGLVLPAQGVTGLAACSQVTNLANSQDRSCLLKGLLILQPSAAHRVTCLANSRPGLAAQGITGLAALSSLTGLPILQTHGLTVCSENSFAESSVSDRLRFWFCSSVICSRRRVTVTSVRTRNRSRFSCERIWSSSSRGSFDDSPRWGSWGWEARIGILSSR
jgi:hypothetical protein